MRHAARTCGASPHSRAEPVGKESGRTPRHASGQALRERLARISHQAGCSTNSAPLLQRSRAWWNSRILLGLRQAVAHAGERCGLGRLTARPRTRVLTPEAQGVATKTDGEGFEHPSKTRGIRAFRAKAAHNPAHLKQKSGRKTPTWGPSLTHGRHCPRRSKQAFWQWFGRLVPGFETIRRVPVILRSYCRTCLLYRGLGSG